MLPDDKLFEVKLKEGEVVTEDTLAELNNGRGEDDE